MLLGLLFALIFGPGGEAEFASSLPKLRRDVKYMVTDDARRDSIVVLIDAYEGAIADYKAESDQLQEQLNKVSADRSVMSEEFLRYYDEYYQSRVKLISSLIDYRLLFQEQITDLELRRVVEDAMKRSSDQVEKEQEREENTEDDLNEAFREIHDIIVGNIADPDKSQVVTESFYEFEASVYSNVDNSLELKAERQAMLLNANPTRDKLAGMYEKSNQLRYQSARDFALLREQVILNTTEKEWKAINKDLSTFFKTRAR
jgi:hypothetical protein